MDQKQVKVIQYAAGGVLAVLLLVAALALFLKKDTPQIEPVVRSSTRIGDGAMNERARLDSQSHEIALAEATPTPHPTPPAEPTPSPEATEEGALPRPVVNPPGPYDNLPNGLGPMMMAAAEREAATVAMMNGEGAGHPPSRKLFAVDLENSGTRPKNMTARGNFLGGPGGGGSTAPEPTPTEGPVYTSVPTATPTYDPDATPSPEPTESPSPTPSPSPSPTPVPAVLFLDPESQDAIVGQTVSFRLMIQSNYKAVGGYSTILLYNPLTVSLQQVLEGNDQYLGFPQSILQGDGSLNVSSFQGTSFDQPIGTIDLLQVDFTCLEAGTASLSLSQSEIVDPGSADLSESPTRFRTIAHGATINIQPAPTATADGSETTR